MLARQGTCQAESEPLAAAGARPNRVDQHQHAHGFRGVHDDYTPSGSAGSPESCLSLAVRAIERTTGPRPINIQSCLLY
jgi:hypothetical protein